MKTNKLVSIITVSFNSEKTIKDTFESILNQTYTNIEYLVIDGASKDKTVDIIKEYEDKFLKKSISFKWLSEKDKGIYDAMNKGINLASGEIIGIINSDDWYEKQAIEIIVEEMEKKKLDFIYGDLRVITPHKVFVKKSKLSFIVTTRYWNHPTSFMNRKIYTQYKYACENIYDDLDLMLKIRKDKKFKVGIVNKIIANFRFGGVSTKKSFSKVIDDIKLRNKIYSKNKYNKLYCIDNLLIEFIKYVFNCAKR